ncbi:uncharacterized protein LOC119075095 [Bradysia coprophila]|uniref:uncharacterized protein LOC119075095 n=1 Tax=Bradysia coprophila TaxID=38358 RepID=UPI00187DB286|nr:uncharacterized protein LOC119075095 [Bradysia coprophila]
MLGREDIERTDVKNIIIVVGPSGVGKSTLTQFVANETNKLRAECDNWEDECWIIDDSGTIGEDLISKTFLPNLVFHESTNTPFYDMPGFNDNRNESMEIANSFFMQQILNDAETVKILVLARYSSFDNSARLDFPNLLMNLVDLIKSPAKFQGSMAIVSTMAPPHLSHDSIIRRNTRFMQESLLDDINNIFRGKEEYIRGSTEILENWLESNTGNYYDAKYFSYFLSASKRGPLLEDPLLYDNKIFLNEVIFDRLEFGRKDDGDFGLPMSGAALRKLEITGSCISNLLATQMKTFAEDLESYILTNVLNVIDGNETNIVQISELLTNLTNSDFSFDNVDGQSLSVHLQKLLSDVVNLQIPSINETIQQMVDTLSFIEFIELTKAEIQFDPILWVINMRPIKENLIKHLDAPAGMLQNAAIFSLAEESEIIAELLLSSIDSLEDISEKDDSVTFEVARARNMFQRIDSAKSTTDELTQFLIFYLSEYDNLRSCENCSSIPQFNAISVLEILDEFSWSSKDWTAASISNLQNMLQLELNLTIFLQEMFIDLSEPIVQTGEDLPIHTWWNDQKKLSEDNFNDFYSIISFQGFKSSIRFDRSQVKDFVFYRTQGRNRLEFLLDSMLKDIYDCPNTSEIIISGKIISFDRVISRCINKQQIVRSSIVLTATFKIFANSKIIGREINVNNNINVILMSPEMIVSNHSEIDLSGRAGQQQGEQGKPAGTQYSLFRQVFSTNDGSIPSKITHPNLEGGHGVNGKVGSTGSGGWNGSNNFHVNSGSDCAAWYSGRIQIRNYVNSCNIHTSYYENASPGYYCWSGSRTIQGTSGGIGGRGGNGGTGSCGAAGGQNYYVDANYFQSSKTAVNGTQGKNGAGGAGGQGGLGGLYGDTLSLYIRNAGTFSRWCEQSDESVIPSCQRASNGPSGSVGTSCTSQVSIRIVNKTWVTHHFAVFKAALSSRNEFIFAHATSFLNLLGNAQPFD